MIETVRSAKFLVVARMFYRAGNLVSARYWQDRARVYSSGVRNANREVSTACAVHTQA